MHLSVDFWIDRADAPDALLSDEAAIAACAKNAFETDPHLVDLARYPQRLTKAEVMSRIRAVSKPYPDELWYRESDEKLTDHDYDRYTASLDLVRIPDTIEVHFGMIVERTAMRSWPTDDVVYKSRATIDLDRFQENGMFPSDAVAVLHESADGKWCFAQSYNYAAWVRKEKLAIGERDQVLSYRQADPFLVIAGNRATTNFNPNTPGVSEVRLEMGARLPLIDPDEVDHNVDGQHPAASYIVQLPVRTEKGALELRHALIARNQDVHLGYMPYTRRNVLHQAFKFLGERYGWGHSYNARDCTGLVLEVFKTFGFVMPRNSMQQGHSDIGENVRFDIDAPAEEKLAALSGADVGDLLYSTGHVMLYLGCVDGEHYVIHDLTGSGWTDDQGNFREGAMNSVSVTPLRKIHASPNETYFDQLYAIKQLR
jgi:cell wall-associated NlpC family hydrolase